MNAEAVCRHYLSNGRREGRYWLVGDVRNTQGRSLFVRLRGPEAGKGAAFDSRDFLAAKRRADTEVLVPVGPKIAVIGGLDFNDHRLIWDKLDRVHAKHPDMALLHGGSPKGAKRIAAKWADHHKVPQIAFKPDWTKHAKAAPFKRNDLMLEVLPIGVMVFPGSGIQDNLADKAKKLGIPVWKFGSGGV